jgi:hypothetical protein
MQSIPTGGYVLVGVDDAGVPSSRLGQLDVKQFDPANLHRIAEGYLPTVQVRSATHNIDGVTVAIIWIGPPEPPGAAIIVRDGQYQDRAKSKHVFSAGDVFVRRGTQSLRWRPSDLPIVLKRWEDSIREEERRRASAYFAQVEVGERGRAIAQGPVGALTWRLASEEFDAALLEAMRADDSVTLRRLILSFGADAASLVRGEVEELDLLLDRLLAALAVAVTYVDKELFNQLLGVLVDVYRTALDSSGNALPSDDSWPQALMWRVVTGVEAVGGLAVRLKQLWAVRPLAQPDQRLSLQMREPSWIRHAVTAASWANLLFTAPSEEGAEPTKIGGPVVAVARQLVERIPALRPDTQVSPFELNVAPEAYDKVLDSLIQFDVFWCIIAVADSGRYHNQFPSFASFYPHRADPALELLINDPEARGVVLEEDAVNLKDAMKSVVDVAAQVAASERRWPWHSDSETVEGFLSS